MKSRKEEIIRATLELAAGNGLGTVSMQQIADKVGITKASLYNHYSSREEIVDAMYEYLRGISKEKTNIGKPDYDNLKPGTPLRDVLTFSVNSYKTIVVGADGMVNLSEFNLHVFVQFFRIDAHSVGDSAVLCVSHFDVVQTFRQFADGGSVHGNGVGCGRIECPQQFRVSLCAIDARYADGTAVRFAKRILDGAVVHANRLVRF